MKVVDQARQYMKRAAQWLSPAKSIGHAAVTPLEAGLRAAFGTEFRMMSGWFESIRSDYFAAKKNRLLPSRSGVPYFGAGADFHYRHEGDYLRMLELARDLDRNDSVVGQGLDRAVTNILQDGFRLDPMTGDPKLDADLAARWNAWANDPRECDVARENVFNELARFALRQMLVDGDHISVGLRDPGALMMVEAHRCRTPTQGLRNIVHGVELGPTRQRRKYWLTIDELDPMAIAPRASAFNSVDTFDANTGVRQVFHVYNGKRVTQTRGVTAFAPIVSVAMLFDDIQFAKLVQQAVVSCWAVVVERPHQFQSTKKSSDGAGPKRTEILVDGSTRQIEGITPGMKVYGKPGEKVTAFSPNIPNPEYFPYVRLILTIVGINLGLPLVMFLMDAAETNFSGWRGAIEQARMGFRANQQSLIRRFHRPGYFFKQAQWKNDDPILRRAAERMGPAFTNHKWHVPGWPYIEPKKDSEAAVIRLKNNLTSPRRFHAGEGRDNEEVTRETVEDRSLMVRTALVAAAEINAKFPEARVDWRELAQYDTKPSKPEAAADPEDDDEDSTTARSRRQGASANE